MGRWIYVCMYVHTCKGYACVCRERVMRRYGEYGCKSEKDGAHVGFVLLLS